MRFRLIAAAVVGMTTAAHADWQFTYWGMSEKQLAALPQVQLREETDEERAKLSEQRLKLPGGRRLASPYNAPEFSAVAWFYFDGDRLAAVRLDISLESTATVYSLVHRQYGTPENERVSDIGLCKIYAKEWRDEARGNVVRMSGLQCESGGGHAQLSYEPIPQGSQSGL